MAVNMPNTSSEKSSYLSQLKFCFYAAPPSLPHSFRNPLILTSRCIHLCNRRVLEGSLPTPCIFLSSPFISIMWYWQFYLITCLLFHFFYLSPSFYLTPSYYFCSSLNQQPLSPWFLIAAPYSLTLPPGRCFKNAAFIMHFDFLQETFFKV